MNSIEKTPRANLEAIIGEVLAAALSAGEITVNQVRAVSAALELAMVPPEGYVLVPVEPTQEMLREIHLVEHFTDAAMRARYAAMLAARPGVK